MRWGLCPELNDVIRATVRLSARAQSPEEIYLVTLEDTITAGNVAYVKRMIAEAEQNNAEAIMALLNTPGRLVDATFDLCRKFLETEVPVVVYVSPAGSIAASAGALILLSSYSSK